MSWQDPMCDWDVQHVPDKGMTPYRQAPARRSLCLAGASAEAGLVVPQRKGHGQQNEALCGRACLLLLTRVSHHVFGKKALPAATALGGAQVSQRHPQHPAAHAGVSCPWGKASCSVGFGKAGCCSMRGTWSIGLSECQIPETTAQMSR